MILKVLGDWEYKPTSCGNKSMTVVFRRLSGSDELKLSRGDVNDIASARFLAAVVRIDNPFMLEMPDGAKRAMVAADIPDIPELSDLYFELIVAYAEKTRVTEDSAKK